MKHGDTPPISFLIRVLSVMVFFILNLGISTELFGVSIIIVIIAWIFAACIQVGEINQQKKEEMERRMYEEEIFKSIYGDYTIQEQARRNRKKE